MLLRKKITKQTAPRISNKGFDSWYPTVLRSNFNIGMDNFRRPSKWNSNFMYSNFNISIHILDGEKKSRMYQFIPNGSNYFSNIHLFYYNY